MTTITAQARVLAAAVNANVPVMLWGEPGVNKSAIIETMFPSWGYEVIPVVASHREPSDFNGLPVVTDSGVRLAAPAWLNRANAASRAIVFLDEFSQAAPATQGGALRMLRERECGETKVGDECRFILAANPPECSAGGWDLAAPTANRMLHLDWEGAAADDWARGLISGWDSITPTERELTRHTPDSDRKITARALVATFIRSNSSRLHELPPDPAQAGRGWASRRSWEMLADVLPWLAADDTEAITLAATGCVGEGAALEFSTWMLNADLPDARAVLNDPSTYDWTDARLDRTFTVLASVVGLAAHDATKPSYQAVWACLAACAEAGRSDVAVPHVLGHQRNAKAGWLPDRVALTAFLPILRSAGLISEVAAA
jgi:hypothetical protein